MQAQQVTEEETKTAHRVNCGCATRTRPSRVFTPEEFPRQRFRLAILPDKAGMKAAQFRQAMEQVGMFLPGDIKTFALQDLWEERNDAVRSIFRDIAKEQTKTALFIYYGGEAVTQKGKVQAVYTDDAGVRQLFPLEKSITERTEA